MIDPFTIKPLDSKTIIDNAKATRGRIITVEDHYYEGTRAALAGPASVHLERTGARTVCCKVEEIKDKEVN